MNTESPFIFPLSVTVKGSMEVEVDCQAELSSLKKIIAHEEVSGSW